MPSTSRYLITTADERTWKFDRPVLFLGEWCRLYDRRHIWQGMDAVVAAPYGLGQVKKDADHAVARALEEQMFPILCAVLNQYHKTQHDLRFWKIVLGHWFRRCVEVVLNRVRTLEACLDAYQISGTTAFSGDHCALASQNSNNAIMAFNDDRWNNELYVRILTLSGEARCPIEVVDDLDSDSLKSSSERASYSLQQKSLAWSKEIAAQFFRLLARENDAFIINSYLPRIEQIKLSLFLKQLPPLWVSPRVNFVKRPDLPLRRNLTVPLDNSSKDQLTDILQTLAFELLPVCYLEGFEQLTATVRQLSWPQAPRCIFTSNNFDTDEVFKLWTALKVEKGTKYIVGQHGNNYGTHRYANPTIEEATADRFLTWGWTGNLAQHVPAFNLKLAGYRKVKHDPLGYLLLSEVHLPHRINTWDCISEFGKYFEDQLSFAVALKDSPRQKLIVRLHSGYRAARWCELARWHDFDNNVRIDIGRLKINKAISECRLVVHSYDSTGILETLSQNIPTLAFWQNGFDHLRESVKPYYQLLVDAGIVHLTAESAAAMVNEIWNDVDGWWRKESVQTTRITFCDQYSKNVEHSAKQLCQLLVDEIA